MVAAGVLRTNRTYLIAYYLNSYNADVGIGFCHSCHHLTIEPGKMLLAGGSVAGTYSCDYAEPIHTGATLACSFASH